MGKLSGRVAVVTGGASGIGYGIADLYAKEGAMVAIVDKNATKAKQVAAHLAKKRGAKTFAFAADVGDEEQVKKAFAQVVKALGEVDILVNNAGVYEFIPLEGVTAEKFHRMFDINVLGLILASQEAVKQFGPEGGNIINISSVAATSAPATASVYSATKAAVNAVTRSLAQELGPRKIRVNSINPGMIETEGLHTSGITESEFRAKTEAQTPLRRIGQPQDIAPMAVFLASSDSAWITGESFYITGGLR